MICLYQLLRNSLIGRANSRNRTEWSPPYAQLGSNRIVKRPEAEHRITLEVENCAHCGKVRPVEGLKGVDLMSRVGSDTTSSDSLGIMRFTPQAVVHLDRQETALLIVDMQYYDAHPDYGVCLKAKQEGREEEARYYVQQLGRIVPTIRRLQDSFRAKGMEVIHIRIASLTRDGRDRSRKHKEGGVLVPPDSKEAQILEELQPVGDEIVISKTDGAVFPSTNIDYVLRNLGIKQLVIVGVVTHGCVEDAVRGAVARNYSVVLVEDACASYTEAMHRNALRELGVSRANVRSADSVIREVEWLN
jgi:nicotinamidase-related amidase